jgi:hypothetical protein
MDETPDNRRRSVARRVALTLGSLGASAAFLWLAFRELDPGIGDALASARFWPWIPAATAAYLGGHVVRGLRCQKLVSNDADLHLATATNIVVLGYGVNNVLPLRMGEVARAVLLSERIGMPLPQSLTVTLLERVLDGFTILCLFLLGSALVPQVNGSALRTVQLASLILGISGLALACVLFFPYGTAALASRLSGLVHAGWREPIWRFLVSVANGLSYLRRPTHALRLAALSLAVWLLEAGMYLLVLPAFGLSMRVEWALLAMTMTNLGILVPSPRGNVGIFHSLCAQALVVLGISGATSAAYAIALHAVFYVPITVWGLGVLLRYGIELAWTTARITDAGRRASATSFGGVRLEVIGTSRPRSRDTTPHRLVVAITEALLPGRDGDPLGPPREQTQRVATFVQGQVNALPTQLRLLLSIGLLGFRTLVRVRHVRGFCSLPLATRREVVNAWAYGRHAPARQLFRVLRSTALLCYYEEASVADPARAGAWTEEPDPREVPS